MDDVYLTDIGRNICLDLTVNDGDNDIGFTIIRIRGAYISVVIIEGNHKMQRRERCGTCARLLTEPNSFLGSMSAKFFRAKRFIKLRLLCFFSFFFPPLAARFPHFTRARLISYFYRSQFSYDPAHPVWHVQAEFKCRDFAEERSRDLSQQIPNPSLPLLGNN